MTAGRILTGFFFSKMLLAIAGLLMAARAWAAETVVAPGAETLSAAVTNATAGDTLILQDGSYSGTTITIDKALTLRAESASAVPAVAMRLNLNAETVLHGLFLQQTVSMDNASADYAFFENTFNATLVDGVSFNSPDMSLVAVGNRFFEGLVIEGAGELIFLAGNEFSENNTLNWLLISARIFFVGNRLDWQVANEFVAIQFRSFSGTSVWGNRFLMDFSNINAPGSSQNLIQFTGAGPVVARNNLFKATASGQFADWSAIDVTADPVFAEIENNVFDMGGFDFTGVDSKGIIDSQSFTTIRSNIFTGLALPTFTTTSAAAPGNRFHNNLCFNTLEACPAGDGNIDGQDPLFVDTTDYVLSGSSPAIDAGPVNGVLLDVDGSTIDLGIYGGAFAIDQYDIQRADARLEPYIYPLFDATRGLDGQGGLLVKVIGVARLR